MDIKLSADALVAEGLSDTLAAHLVQKIEELAPDHDLEDIWPAITARVLDPGIPFEAHLALYRYFAGLWDAAEGPMPAWMPSIAVQHCSNIHTLAERRELYAYDDLYAWSLEDPAAYWAAVMDCLGIVFQQPYHGVVDLSEGVTSPNWLPGARLNIAESCFYAEADQPAVIYRDAPDDELQTMTYAELDRESNRVANGLVDAGFKTGDALAVDMTMNVHAVIIYLGIVKAGCRVVSIADSFSPTEIATRLRIGKAVGIFTMDHIGRGEKKLPMYKKVVDAEAPRAFVLPLGEQLDAELRDGDMAWTDFLAESTEFTPVSCEPGDITNILFSSGTTGEPKAIPWTHTTPIKAAADGFIHQDIHPGEVVCWPTNLGWMMGPWLIYATLINKGTIALYGDAPNTASFCKFVQDAEVSVLGVVPSLVKAWKQADALDGLDWTNLKLFSSTGECSNANDMLWLMAVADYKPVIEYCGGTEVGGGYLTGTVVHPAVPAAFTTPAMGIGLKILDEENNDTDMGEVFLQPPSMGLSTSLLNRDHHEIYFKDTPKDEKGNPLRRHGDQIEKLPGGFYRAHGRADDTMNLGGIKVSSAEIERVLEEVSDIDEAAAVAVPPPEGGPGQLIVFVVMLLDRDEASLRAELQEAIRFKLNPLFKIHDIVVQDVLPRTASGKVMRRVLRSRYLNERDG
ncbi:MAG: AMP-binding protein [Acidobacteriota bacterium]|nr:AMP-binding protein [Acidobacteriota bacterium]